MPSFDAARPEAIFHLAAQSSVTVSVNDPTRDCRVNVQGTLNVLEAAARHRAPIVFSSTGGALYGDDAPIPTGEDRIPAPLAPYGASKWAGEAYVTTWAASSRLPHAICRLGNVYGPRQSPHGEAGVVAIFSHHLWSGTRPTVFGGGTPTRDYVHVADVVRCMRVASGTRGVFNVATGIETDVLTLLDGLQRAAGTALEPVLAPLREGELLRSCLAVDRARERARVSGRDRARRGAGARPTRRWSRSSRRAEARPTSLLRTARASCVRSSGTRRGRVVARDTTPRAARRSRSYAQPAATAGACSRAAASRAGSARERPQ